MSKKELEEIYSKRLTPHNLRALFEEELLHRQLGREADLTKLATKYGIEKEVLEKVLQWNRLAAVKEESDGRLIAKNIEWNRKK